MDSSEKRRTNRIKHRLTCELVVGDQAHPAVVRDIAPTGLFLQTRQRPEPNSVVEVRFPPCAAAPGFTIEAGVARHRNVHPRLQAEIQSGVGLEILGRPPAYLALAQRVSGTKSPGDPAAVTAGSDSDACSGRAAATTPAPGASGDPAAEPAPRSYRVRLAAHGRSHPRTLTVQATSLAAARARAVTQAGSGWKVTEVESI